MATQTGSTLRFQRPLGRLHGGLRDALVLSLVASMTTWVALLSWRGFSVAWGGFMGPLVAIAVVVALSGALLRWLRVPGALVVLGQLLIVGAVVSLYVCDSLLPIGDAWTRLELAFEDASASAQQYSAPVPRGVPPIDPLLIAGGAACMLLVDIVVGTLRRVPLAGLPLLTIYSIPVSLLGGGVSWIVFTLTAVGFLLMLYLQESRQIARWGRPLGGGAGQDPDPSGFGVSNGALKSSATAIGAAATALAVIVPVFIPTFGIGIFDGGFGKGGGNQLKIVNPTADLMRDLRRGEDYPMVQVTTDDPNPEYLRVAVLNRFSDNEWSSGDRTASSDQSATGEVPAPAGLDASVPTREFDYDVKIFDGFSSTWLPTQFPISYIQAPGDWRYDLTTMDFMAFDEDLNARGMSYSMTSIKPTLDAEDMARSGIASTLMNTQFTELPGDLSPSIRNAATTHTADYPTRFQKAVALQNWLRDEGEYTLTDGPPGNGSDTLADFLNPALDDVYLTGYCEQFAAAMAVMARTLNIPSRLALGFLEPEKAGPNTYVYSSHDLHAWPELYFPGSGWVRFEPTPPDRATAVPGYTEHEFPSIDDPLPSSANTSDDIIRPSVSDPREENQQGQAAEQSGPSIPWRVIAIGALALALLVGLALLPRAVRRRRRTLRLGEGPEPVWIELRDTVVDLGLTWPAGRSPRETGSHLVHYFGPPVGTDPATRPRHGAGVAPEAETALERIVGTIERQRYARPGTAGAALLKADAETVIGSLEGGVTPHARRRATWLPRSLFVSRRRPTGRGSANTDHMTYTGVVDHVG